MTPERHPLLNRYGILLSDAVTAVLTLLGALAAVDGSGRAPLLLGLAILGVVLRFFGGLRFDRVPVLGAGLVPRILAVSGVAVALSDVAQRNSLTATGERASAGDQVGALLGAVALVAGIVGEPYLRRAARFQPPLVANLPGIDDPKPIRDLTRPTLVASLAATAVGLAVDLAHASPWWFFAAAVLALVPAGLVAVSGRRQILLARSLRKRVPQAVADYAPEFVIYTSRPDDASYQVTMWLPYLQRAGQRFLIVTRNGTPAQALAALTDVPIVEARKLSDLDGLVPPSLKAAFYVNASSGNAAFVRYQHLTHVYLGHGDSDKPPSYNPTHAMYDRIFAAGPAATRRYAAHGVRIPSEKFQIVGRPQVEGVQVGTRHVSEVPNPVFLYAPTWRGHVEETMLYSLPVGERIVSALLARGGAVIFRPHPFSYGFAEDAATIVRIQELLAADARETGRAHLWGPAAESERGIFDCINASDAMVSDVSSVVSDYLFSGKPFAMIAVPSEPDAFAQEYPVAQAAYIVRGDLADLDASLDQMLGPDLLLQRRAAIRVDYLGDFPADDYASGFVEAVRSVTSSPVDPGEDHDDEEGEGSAGTAQGSWSSYSRILVDVGLNLSGTVFALTAFGAALFDWPLPLVLALGILSSSALLQVIQPTLEGRGRWERLLRAARSPAPRTVLLVVIGLVASDGGRLGTGWSLALALLAVALVGETQIRAAWGRVGLQVHGFRALNADMPELLSRELVPLIGLMVLLVDLALAAADAPVWLAVTLSVAFFVVYVDSVVRALMRIARLVRAEQRLHEALVEYAPEFALYFASTVGAAYQMGMWLPFMVRIGRPFIIVTRNVSMLREIAGLLREQGLDVPIIQRPTLRSLEEVIVPSLTTSFYVNNAVRNAHFVERRELTHVWLNHGDSEKPACYNPVHAIYDLLFAAGQAGIDRYARHGIAIPEEKFRIVGRPQVESIEPARGPVAEQSPPTVLYAPTWQGPFADTRVYSLPMGRAIVERLLASGARVIFRAHPFNYRFPESVAMINDIGRLLAADRSATGREHLWGAAAEQRMTIEECFNASDAMVSDVSAVVSDYLRSDKPFAIVSVGRTPESLMKEAPAARAAYVLRQDLGNLEQVIGDLLGPDPLASVRRETKIYYLGDFGSDSYAEGFLKAAREVIDGVDQADAVQEVQHRSASA